MTAPLRYAAFAAAPGGGNPAGVVLDAAALTDAEMQAVAADVGYSETAFVTSRETDAAPRRVVIRYFSPVAEVPFCGHATIATAVALAERRSTGEFVFETPVGDVVISTADGERGIEASFTSVEPSVEDMPDETLDRLLALLGVTRASLDPRHPPRI